MESVGDEKKIRALFSELKIADEQTAPGFTAVWHRAQARSMKPRRAFNLSFAVATALLVCGLASLAVWSMYSRPAAPVRAFAIVAANDFSAPQINDGSSMNGPTAPVKNDPQPGKSRRTKLAAQRQALMLANNRRAAKEAKTIESWQSPTASLLSSPSDDLFKSLPQLNENANELKSFLPNRANDKEK
jgi:hypothetical protein